jgi:3-hydroxyacyl-[acyl-carrier-protein] dehydratase
MSTMSQHNKIAAVNFGPFSPAVESKLLFPIAHLDPAACVADAVAIARINPHRHEMALLDRMVWHSEDFVFGVGLKHVRADEFWVRGHFPERPMYPGVLMIESAAQLACFLYNSRQDKPTLAAFLRLEDAAFRHSVEPGQTLILLSQEVKYSPRRFVTRVQGVVEGEIAFDAQITGMSLGPATSME